MRRNKDFTKLPESELQIMQFIWDMEKMGVKDIHGGAIKEAYNAEIGHLALTTVLTLMTRLENKGFITLEKHGRTNCAVSAVDEAEYKRKLTEDFVKVAYHGDKKELIAALCSDGVITVADLDELRREM